MFEDGLRVRRAGISGFSKRPVVSLWTGKSACAASAICSTAFVTLNTSSRIARRGGIQGPPVEV